jgi:hypothetical protein
MAITKQSGRQKLVAASVMIDWNDFSDLSGSSTPQVFEAIDLPDNANIVSVNLTVTTPFNTEGQKATGTFTLVSNYLPVANDTVTIGTKTYTYVSALSTGPTVANEVVIGNEAVSKANLIAAINGDAGIGTLYSTGTVAHTLVDAAAGTTHTIVLTAKTGGTAGNAIATTASHTKGSFGAVTLTGGLSGGDILKVTVGSETFLNNKSAVALACFEAADTLSGKVYTSADSVDVSYAVAATSIARATQGRARLNVTYIVDGRTQFSCG